MTRSSWREEFARLGPTRAVDRVPSGSRAVLAIRPSDDLPNIKTISATLALVKRGLTMLRAKRAIEEALDHGRAVVVLPTVEDETILARDLSDNGFTSAVLKSDMVDLKDIRERLGLSQEQFAVRFGLDVDSVQNWETGRRLPDTSTRSYLKVIGSLPDEVSAALETPLG